LLALLIYATENVIHFKMRDTLCILVLIRWFCRI